MSLKRKGLAGETTAISGTGNVGTETDVELVDASGGARTRTLPDPATVVGMVVLIKKIDSSENAVTIGTAAGNIDGSSTHMLRNQYDQMRVISDGTNWYVVEHSHGGVDGGPSFKSYGFTATGLSLGTHWIAGFYEAPAAAGALDTAGSTTQTLGSANGAYGAHAFLVAAAAGGANVVITVSGTSITDAGVRTAGDSEVLTNDASGLNTDDYLETVKKWIGQITYTISGGPGTLTFNYGFAKYEDWGNRNFKVTDFDAVGIAGANDSGFELELLLHSDAGWTYSAAAFVPGGTVITDMASEYVTEDQLINGDHFAFKRTGLTQEVLGSGTEGYVVKIVNGANNAIDQMDVHVGVNY